MEELHLGKDDNTEHYRYRLMQDYLQRGERFEDHALGQIVELMQIDINRTMAGSILIGLLNDRRLTIDQFTTTAEALKTFGEWTLKHINKAQSRR